MIDSTPSLPGRTVLASNACPGERGSFKPRPGSFRLSSTTTLPRSRAYGGMPISNNSILKENM
ncbi:MAG: hypothetical protein CMN25_11775 [Salinicola sp.]|nr:hypothetical protein [Salinicola sp.]